MIKKQRDLVMLLIEKFEDSVISHTSSSETLLHLAVKAKRLEMVELLTELGVTKLVLNEKDANQNTSLHLAFAGRQEKVIEHLLSQDDIEVNAMNLARQTPLDLLLVTNHEIGDLRLGEILRAAGGKTGKEVGASDTHWTSPARVAPTGLHQHEIEVADAQTSPARVVSSPSNQARRTSSLTKTEENYDSIGNLMVVATLVATVTFSAALNPPGGSIQMSYNDNGIGYWKEMRTLYPAGSPVYLWQLKHFFRYNSIALFTSVGVMLLCLSDLARYIFFRKFTIFVLWMSIFCMVTAFFSAIKILYHPQEDIRFHWFKKADYVWNFFFGLALLRLIIQAISYAIEERPSYLPKWLRRLCEKVYSIQNWCESNLGFIGYNIIRIIVGFGIGWWFGWVLDKLER